MISCVQASRTAAIENMKKLVFLVYLISFSAFASGQLTTINPSITLYSEHYPNLHAKFKGTIVFENGSGTDMNEWKSNHQFFQCVQQMGSLFLYDRNGLGKSPPDLLLSRQHPITGKLVSANLLALLKQRHIKPPYLLVAHSYGAIYAGYFALKYPYLVKGLLLVDPVPKSFHFSKELMQKYQSGVNEATKQSASYMYKHYKGSEAEVTYQLLGFAESKRSIKQLGSINNSIPVIIISSTSMEKEKRIEEDWYDSQKQWLNHNPNSKIMRVISNHFIQLEQPQTVCQQMKKIIAAIE